MAYAGVSFTTVLTVPELTDAALTGLRESGCRRDIEGNAPAAQLLFRRCLPRAK